MNNKKTSILQKGRGKERKQQKFEYIYEKDSVYFAQVSESIKDLALAELKSLGAYQVKPFFGGIEFKASKEDFYKINYCTRLVSRVLAPLVSFECNDSDTLYKKAKKIRWEEFLTPKKTFAIMSNVSDSEINHSQYASLRLKDAVADYFRDRTNKRPNVDTLDPDLQINLHIRKNFATISIDASLGPLHKRGYREETVTGPMQEIVAAAIIKISGWDGSIPLHDPMCGSGTLLCEALMKYSNIPAGIFRKSFGFERLPDFDKVLFEKVKEKACSQIKELPLDLISGSDISKNSVNAAKTNLMGLHFGGNIKIDCIGFEKLTSLKKSLIVVNPPYGIRMGKDKNLNELYKGYGDFLKQKCQGSTAFVYFGEAKFLKKIGLKPSFKQPIKLGGLEGILAKYEIF